tara:strand:- start:90 stop:221 length:132 start_codon:yes stop_codon:yes gene_type:complete
MEAWEQEKIELLNIIVILMSKGRHNQNFVKAVGAGAFALSAPE